MIITCIFIAISIAWIGEKTIPKIPWMERGLLICAVIIGVSPFLSTNPLAAYISATVALAIVIAGVTWRHKHQRPLR